MCLQGRGTCSGGPDRCHSDERTVDYETARGCVKVRFGGTFAATLPVVTRVWLAWTYLRSLIARWLGWAPTRPLAAVPSPTPTTEAEREVLAALGKCVACGACDAAFDAYGKVVRSELRGPSELPLAFGRSLEDLDATAGWLVHLEKGDLARLERACPVGVPFSRAVVTLKARAGIPRVRATKVAHRRHDPG